METCDVLIVGGGPAGSTCARRLRRGGLDVLVLDKKTFPRDKTCAGWITPPVVEELELETDEYRRERVFQPITRFRTGMIGGPEVQVSYGGPVSYGIRRCEFDDYLLQRSGARLRLGEALRTMRREGRAWVLNGSIHTRLVIGAGGHFCPVARQLGARETSRAAVVTAQEVEFEIPGDELGKVAVEPECPELYFCDDLKGYGWCFRKRNVLNIGLGRTDPDQLTDHVAAFGGFLRERQRIGCATPVRFHGHAYQLYEREVPKLAEDGVLLIGDAAGLAYPQSGEGIRPAVESGLIAADVILQAGSCWDAEHLRSYVDRLTARLGPPRRDAMADRVPAAWLRFAASRLITSRWFSRHVVLDRWFLHANEPALSL